MASPPDPISMLQDALTLHQRGQPAQAEALCKNILRHSPHQIGALQLLGVIAADQNRQAEGDRWLAHALALRPNSAGAHANRGAALTKLGRWEHALAALHCSLALRPDHAPTLLIRANAQAFLKRHDEALADYDRVLSITPMLPDAWVNRGAVLVALDRLDEALSAYDRALALRQSDRALKGRAAILLQRGRWPEALATFTAMLAVAPQSAEALLGRGQALAGLERTIEALECFDQARAILPYHAGTLHSRGGALSRLDRKGEAQAEFDRSLALVPDAASTFSNRAVARDMTVNPAAALADLDCALALNPTHAEAWSNRGTVHMEMNRTAEALDSFDRALEIKPAFAEARSNRGKALFALRRFDEAITAYDQALAIRPNFPAALSGRAHVLRKMRRPSLLAESQARLVALDPDFPYALGQLLNARLQLCDWTGYATLTEHIKLGVRAGKRVDLPLSFYVHSRAAGDQLQCARVLVADQYPPAAEEMWSGERSRHDRLRVAYASSNFHEHAIGRATIELFELHDQKRIETFAISFDHESTSEIRRRALRAFPHFIDVRDKSDRDTALLLRRLEIDIAIDLDGFTTNSRPGIFAHRPAPIQVNYLGQPGTLGAPYIQYILADRHVIPAAQERHYAEAIAFLPGTYLATDTKTRIADRVLSRTEADLPETGFVFCCFNQNYKITPEIFDVWMRLLRRISGSALWLLAGDATAHRNLEHEAERRGVAPQRLVFAPRMNRDEHLARYRLADLFLDTLPYNAHTTAGEALWAGLPVITCAGETFASRVAASVLHAVGMNDLVTTSLAEYESLAYKLATTPGLMKEATSRLAHDRNTHALFDTDSLRRHIEVAYFTMWERHRHGKPPASFHVLDTPGQIAVTEHN